MKRREFLKGLTGASVAMMASEIAYGRLSAGGAHPGAIAAAKTIWNLNIFVHGMFAIVLDLSGLRYKDGKKIKLLAPRVVSNHGGSLVKHRYFAKMFQPYGTNDLQQTYSHEIVSAQCVPWKVKFEDVQPNAQSFDPMEDQHRIIILVDQASDVDGKPAWTVDLPGIPTDICQLRAAHHNFFNTPSLTYSHSKLNFDQWFPVVNVIRYEFSAKPKVSFTPETGPTQQVSFDGNRVGRLHLFAEPDTQPDCTNGHDSHLQDAICEFNHLFDQNLDLGLTKTAECLKLNSDPIPASCSKSGILLCEERTLEELLGQVSCSKFASKRPQVQDQYKKDEDTQKILKSWKAFLLDQKKSSREHIDRSTLTKLSEEFIESNQKLLSGGKPPSNCMSMVCLHP